MFLDECSISNHKIILSKECLPPNVWIRYSTVSFSKHDINKLLVKLLYLDLYHDKYIPQKFVLSFVAHKVFDWFLQQNASVDVCCTSIFWILVLLMLQELFSQAVQLLVMSNYFCTMLKTRSINDLSRSSFNCFREMSITIGANVGVLLLIVKSCKFGEEIVVFSLKF